MKNEHRAQHERERKVAHKPVAQEGACCTSGYCGAEKQGVGEELVMLAEPVKAKFEELPMGADSAQSSSFEELTMLSDPTPVGELQPDEARSVFHVDGMDCGECARTVERVMRNMDGIRDVQVNFNTTKMTVIHTADIAAMMKAVDQVGYRATLLDTTLPEPGVEVQSAGVALTPWEKHKRTITIVVSGIFTGAGLIAEHIGLSPATWIFCYVIAILSGGFFAARAGYYALKSRTLDMNFLMTVAALGAAAIGQWSEGASVVFLFSIGNWLQSMTMERTRHSIRLLIELTPQEALVKRGNAEVTLALADIRIGDTVIVRPGERIPMDGVLTSGSSTVNQAPVTGEAMPLLKEAGDDVFAGTINESGAFEFRVTKRAADSTIARMIHLVEAAQAQKAPSEQFVDVFAKSYTPIVVLLAVLIAILPPLFTAQSFHVWVYRALVLLVIACPCALVISTPVAIVAAIGHAAKRGVLIKGGAFLEQLGAVRAIAFDKTGTLTEGRPQVVAIEPWGDITNEELLTFAAALESRSEHPLAKAILQAHASTGRTTPVVEQFRALAGRGAQGIIDGSMYYIGKPAWIAEFGYNGRETDSENEHLHQGHTVMVLASEHEMLGLIAVADVVRAESAETITRLKTVGVVHTAMLTGDHEQTAAAIQSQVHVDESHGHLLPEQKVEHVRHLQDQFGRVAMIGDGINDAPALAVADIGIAMGGAGTDAALETADIVLMSDDLKPLPFAVQLSRKALQVIKQNIWFALLVKVVFLVLTVLGLANLWMAVFADTGAALIVIGNGMRLMSKNKNERQESLIFK